MMPRYAANVDNNQQEIVQALIAAGASVHYLKVPVDLLVGYAGKTVLVEIKNLKTAYGRKGANKLQKSFMETWSGGAVSMLTDVASAMTMLRVMGGAV